MLCNGGVMWNGLMWEVVRCKIFWGDVMECVTLCEMQFEPYLLHQHNSTCDVECGRNTHMHETNSTQLHARRQSNQSPEEKRWVLRAELKDTTEDMYLL